MPDILEKIVAYKRKELELFKKELSPSLLIERVGNLNPTRVDSMVQVLQVSTTGIIAEFKRKSPSKGWINKNASPSVIPLSYQNNGASALSILTDLHFFGGSNINIRSARLSGAKIPVLYKNFIIDEYQIYQARLNGSSAILLIAACLTKEECKNFIGKAHELGMEVLLEIHNEEELSYLELEPDMCGINNRNLGTFETDVNNSFNLVSRLPVDMVKVSESGISDPNIVRQLRGVGFKGFLIGEHFMKTEDPGMALQQFIAQLS